MRYFLGIAAIFIIAAILGGVGGMALVFGFFLVVAILAWLEDLNLTAKHYKDEEDI